MSRPCILSVVGARPQFVKAAVVSKALSELGIREVLTHTGQHYDADMSAVFFEELDIPSPAHFLGVGSGPHGAQTGRMLELLEEVLLVEKPDRVLLYGDTNSTLAGALAAAKLHIPVDHIEAGLRSFNRRMPEETNRVVADHLADLCYAPTTTAVENLRREGVPERRIVQTGDVMFDAMLAASAIAECRGDVVDRLGLQRGTFILATVHRAENVDEPSRLRAIVDGLIAVSARNQVILPLHPRTRKALSGRGWLQDLQVAVTLTAPLGFLDMVQLESHAALIATDSGGMQKEAFFHGIPCVTLRAETEWVELIDMGWNVLADPGAANIAATIAARVGTTGSGSSPYGDGRASEQIAARIQIAMGGGSTVEAMV